MDVSVKIDQCLRPLLRSYMKGLKRAGSWIKSHCTTRSFELSALALESNDNKVRTCMYFVQPLLAKARPDDCP